MLKVSKEGRALDDIGLSTHGAIIFGRNTEGVTCGAITLDHESISRRHAAIVHDLKKCTYVIDLGSRHGTRLDGKLLRPREYHAISEGSVLTFGASTRQYRVATPGARADEEHGARAEAGAEPAAEAPVEIDIDALRRLGPGARAKLTPAEQRALEAVSTLEDEDDPMRNYVDDPAQFGGGAAGAEGANGEREARRGGDTAQGGREHRHGRHKSKRREGAEDERSGGKRRREHAHRTEGEGKGSAHKDKGKEKAKKKEKDKEKKSGHKHRHHHRREGDRTAE